MARSLLALVAALALAAPALSQPVWTDVPASRAEPRDDLRAYRLVRLDADALRARLADGSGGRQASLEVPLPGGGSAAVAVAEASVMAAPLQARYPQIRAYAVSGALTGRFAVTPAGVSALFHGPDGPLAIDPVEGDLHAVYRAADLVVPEGLLGALADDALAVPGAEARIRPPAPAATGPTLRTYRLAVSARGEYTQARSDGTVAGGLAAVAATVARANALFERDLAVTFELVADNDKLIFTDPETDPFVGRGRGLLDQNQAVVDAEIGAANYDVGHVLGLNDGGGVAFVGAACVDGYKAGGASGVGYEVSAFDLVVFPHELGHMLGAPHAFVEYLPGTGLNPDGAEPGPGYTIMAYGQFARDRPDGERIGFHFHGTSLDFMDAHVRRGAGQCGADAPTGNEAPVVTVPQPELVVPTRTAFGLTGSAADAEAVTYVWEQVDLYGAGEGALPLVRSLDPGPSPHRAIPDLGRAVEGAGYRDEAPPSRPGPHRFRLTARDGLGGVGAAEVVVTAVEAGGGFVLTSQTVPTVVAPRAPVRVAWDVAGTDAPPFDVREVSVLTSFDGLSWGLAVAATPNDGEVTIPAPQVGSMRLMVRPAGGAFHDPGFYALSAAAVETGPAPVADLAEQALRLRVAPGETAEGTLTLANRGPDGTELTYDLSVRRLTLPDGASVERRVGVRVAEAGAPGGPAPGFEDLSASGARVPFADGADDQAVGVTLPFAFPFFDGVYGTAAITTNGFLQVVGADGGAYTNGRIPEARGPNGVIAPFWDDLRLEGGAVYTRTLDDGRFAVQWDRVGRFVPNEEDSGVEYTFQAVLSPDGTVEFQYGALDGPTSNATVGVEGPAGERGVELAFNEPYLRAGHAVRFDPARTWLAIATPAGTLASGGAATLRFAADAAGFAEGDRVSAEVRLRTNDGALPDVTIPVTLEVTSAPVAAEGGPAGAVVSLVAPNPASGRASLTVALAAPGAVRATLLDVLGREVAVLHDGPAAGTLALAVDAGRLAAGAYVVRVVGEGVAASRRLVVVR